VKPLVIKIGGSLVETGRLQDILAIVARSKRSAVIVPGGGPFADAVRRAQAEIGFSDETAHEMAILTMHQTAALMREMEPALVVAETLAAMRTAWAEQRVAVWLPARLCARDRRIPRNWTITSDGLAARLAERLGRAPVVLIKSRTVSGDATAAELAREGVVDAAFAQIQHRARLQWSVIGPGEERRLAALLRQPEGLRLSKRARHTAKIARSEASTARR
jgi:aspartokinase-like uncharacterized kinase